MNLLPLSLESLPPLYRACVTIKIAIVVVCCGLCSSVPAVTSAPDGGYPNGNTAEGDGEALLSQQPSKFVFKDASGKATSVDVVETYQPKKIVRPFAKIDRQVDPKLMRAATIAKERAHAHSRRQCWRYVKEALLAS